MDNYQSKVLEWHIKNGIPYLTQITRPKFLSRIVLRFVRLCLSILTKLALKTSRSNVREYRHGELFRLHLILDEVAEICHSLENPNLSDLADCTTDLLYVTFGVQVTYGIPSKECFEEVHRSNMTKDFKSLKRREYKGEAWVPPDFTIPLLAGRERLLKEAKDAYN